MFNEFLESVSLILEKGKNTTSYKFALLRSLIDYGKTYPNQPLKISYDWLAEQFISYFWDMTIKFRIQQSNNRETPPIVMSFIEEEIQELNQTSQYSFKKYQTDYPERLNQLKDKTKKVAFNDVIDRFHNIETDVKRLYEKEGKSVLLSDESYKFLNLYQKPLLQMCIGSWVRFTENFTSAPKLYEKILNTNVKRGSLTKYKKFLVALLGEDNIKCFYSDESVPSNSPLDHFIPHSFILEDNIFNLVFIKEEYNGANEKWSSLPKKSFVKKLEDRNENLLAKHNEGEFNDIPEFSKIKSEFAGISSNDLNNLVRRNYDNCEISGFGIWNFET